MMTATEALRLQLDNLQKEKQDLRGQNFKFSQIQPDTKALLGIEKERDHWKREYEGVMAENAQSRAFYEELLKHTST